MAKAVKTPKTNAMRELESAGISYVLHTYEDDGDESVGLGVAISEQLGEEPGQGFKTLVCVTPSNDHVVCCIPVADELDLKSAARAAGEKSLVMMHVKDLLAATGYVRGGCSPVGMKNATGRSLMRRVSFGIPFLFREASVVISSSLHPMI